MEKSCENCKFNMQQPNFDLKLCKKCSRTDRAFFEPIKELEEPIPTAATLMESLLRDGTYLSLKQLKNQLDALKKEVRYRLKDSEVNRHEYEKYNVVAKFVRKPITQVDNQGLIENLFCFLQDKIVCSVIRLDTTLIKKEIPEELVALKEFEHPSTYYVKPSFNKKGKELLRIEGDYPLGELNINQLVKRFIPLQERLKNLEELYESQKKTMSNCEALKANNKLKHEFGSISLIANRPAYNMDKILEVYGEDFLIQYAAPDSVALQSLIDRRILPKSEVERFQIIMDYRLDFMMMNLEVERKITSQFQQIAIQKSLSLFG
ncbi:hypothetical protein K7887_22435 (plasmid) [Sutcliffiella horikoshii]|uniref:hypothetical protein n=1 Tax=Sutcliffiella horikoshii TaxID=79883 RepID=UPI001CBE538B|nr:hypothetical protein [Sutcliffiella horikoshii]UAL49878.1 hypothetical protein K7887_22435 [Sutcliffiella horikoshii]